MVSGLGEGAEGSPGTWSAGMAASIHCVPPLILQGRGLPLCFCYHPFRALDRIPDPCREGQAILGHPCHPWIPPMLWGPSTANQAICGKPHEVD